jgi:hypothetical protein
MSELQKSTNRRKKIEKNFFKETQTVTSLLFINSGVSFEWLFEE